MSTLEISNWITLQGELTIQVIPVLKERYKMAKYKAFRPSEMSLPCDWFHDLWELILKLTQVLDEPIFSMQDKDVLLLLIERMIVSTFFLKFNS